MFSLLAGLAKYLFQPREYYILILGLDGAGKTCMLERLKAMHRPNYQGIRPDRLTPTIGLNVGRVVVGSLEQSCANLPRPGLRMIFWDVGGMADLQYLWETYYAECHGIVYVIDATDNSRLRLSKESFDRMIQSPALEGVPLLVLANKQDVDGAMTIRECKAVFNESAGLIGARDCKVHGVSALSGDMLEESVQWLTEKVQRNLQRPPAQPE